MHLRLIRSMALCAFVPGLAFGEGSNESNVNPPIEAAPSDTKGAAPESADLKAAPESSGPLPPLPQAPPLYYTAPPPSYRPRWRKREWAAQIRIEGIGLGSDAASGSGMGGVGASLRPRPAPHFAVDFGLDFFGGHDFHAERREEIAFTVNPMLFVNPGRPVQLYFLAGLGFAGAKVTHADQTESRYRYVGVDAGIGIEFRIARHIALDADVLGFLRGRVDRGRNSAPEFVDASSGRSTNTSGGGLARLGLAYYW
jgi:hypothetical protein